VLPSEFAFDLAPIKIDKEEAKKSAQSGPKTHFERHRRDDFFFALFPTPHQAPIARPTREHNRL
jgi:hypothetical protein